MSRSQKYKRKMPLWQRILLISVIVIGIGAVAYVSNVVLEAYKSWDQMYEVSDQGNESESDEEEEVNEKDSNVRATSILLLGVDSRRGTLQGLPDVIMVAVLNEKSSEATLVSIPRDTYVKIPGKHYDKLNHTYSYGGTDMIIDTLEHFLDMPIDHYLVLNFDAFTNFVNLLGGLQLDVERRIYDYDAGTYYRIEAGEQVLSAKDALYYTRFRRDSEGDFGRMRRQQQVISEVLNQTLDMRNMGKITEMFNILGENVRHDIPFRDMVSLARNFSSFKGDDLETIRLEGGFLNIDNISYVDVSDEDQQRVQQKLKERMYGSASVENEQSQILGQ